MFRTLSHACLSLIFPEECRSCRGRVDSIDDGVACTVCWSNTRIFDGNETLCIKCGAFLFEGASRSMTLCRECSGLHFDQAFATGLYEHALAVTIIQMKQTPKVCRRLRTLLTTTFDRIALRANPVLVPIPLSAKRQRERGFNQAGVIAAAVAKHSGVQIDSMSLIRKVHTPMHRAGMDRKARAVTVKNAFDVMRPKLIADRDVLLIDDVLTSGETASMCAKVLKENGAATVKVLTAARAI